MVLPATHTQYLPMELLLAHRVQQSVCVVQNCSFVWLRDDVGT